MFYTNIIRTANNPDVIARATNSIGRTMRVVLQLHWHFLLVLCSVGSEEVPGFKWCGKWGWGALMLQEWPSPSLPEDQVLLARWDFIWRSTSTAPRARSLQMFPAWCDAHSAEHWHQPSAEWSSALTEGMAGRGEVPWHHPVWCKAPFLCLHTALVQWWQERVKCKSVNGFVLLLELLQAIALVFGDFSGCN